MSVDYTRWTTAIPDFWLCSLLTIGVTLVYCGTMIVASAIILPGPLVVPAVDTKSPVASHITQTLLKMKRGTNITVWIVEPTAPKGDTDTNKNENPIVICNFGNCMSLDSDGERIANDIHRVHPSATVILWDYSGVGRSAGITSPSYIESDAKEIAQWASSLSQMDDNDNDIKRPIICWGHSLGTWGASVMAVELQERCHRLVLSAAFSSLKNVNWLAYFLGFGAIAPQVNVAKLSTGTQLCLVQAMDDALFPFHHAETLAKQYTSSNPISLFKTIGGHNSTQTIRIAIKHLQ